MVFLSAICAFGQSMDNEKLQSIIYTMSDTLAGEEGRWQFVVGELPMFCLTDETHNRMRIISPVAGVSEVEPDVLLKCLEANFHSALDVRYSISDDVIWVAFIHPLRELSKDQVIDAVTQVYSAVATFGESYTSTSLTFPTNQESNPRLH